MSDELSPLDLDALERAVAITLAEPDADRIDQVRWKLVHDGWGETAQFCSFHRQIEALKLACWDLPPCEVDPERVDAILATGRKHDDFRAAKLARRLLDAGLSLYEPDPVAALRKANAARRASQG